MKIVDSAAMTAIDSRAQSEYSIPAHILMENAGVKAYKTCAVEFALLSHPEQPVVFVAGTGSNGGDALVMARQAFGDGLNVSVLLFGPIKSAAAELNLDIIRKLRIPLVEISRGHDAYSELLRDAAYIFDGLFGTGINGKLRADAASLVAEMNESDATVISIDLPSGLGDGFKSDFPMVKADVTLCLGLPKRSLFLPSARKACGRILFVPIGFPPELVTDSSIPGELLEKEDLAKILPPVSADAYKTTRGRLTVFAGSTGTAGAAVLCCQAAARSRCGMVDLYVDSSACQQAASHLISVMVRTWDPAESMTMIDDPNFTSFLAGPGWGREGRQEWLEKLIECGIPGVLDADALHLLRAMSPRPDLGGRIVLTPHPGEASILAGVDRDILLSRPLDYGLEISRSYNAVVLLKSHITFICEPGGRYWILDAVNPALGTAGSGDVLAGVTAGIMAGGTDPATAARIAALIHSIAGEHARSEKGWFIAEDLLPFVSRAFEEGP